MILNKIILRCSCLPHTVHTIAIFHTVVQMTYLIFCSHGRTERHTAGDKNENMQTIFAYERVLHGWRMYSASTVTVHRISSFREQQIQNLLIALLASLHIDNTI